MKITKSINHNSISIKITVTTGAWVKYRAGRRGATITSKGAASIINPILAKMKKLFKTGWDEGKSHGEIVDSIESHFSN